VKVLAASRRVALLASTRTFVGPTTARDPTVLQGAKPGAANQAAPGPSIALDPSFFARSLHPLHH